MKIKNILIVILLTSGIIFGQLKSQKPQEINVGSAMLSPKSGNLLFGFFNPSNFKMSHSYNFSYTSFGKSSLALGVYTNSMFYKISDPLTMELDISLTHSPFNSFGREFQNQFNGIFVSRAALNWRPTENTLINVEFRNLPSALYLMNPYYRYYPSWYRYDEAGFNDWYLGR
ncbi:MAG: hypothetical protein WHV63_09535 [Ignavibacteria bacterium]|nr:hypothetical protein [Ignavibacteria bacterium]